MSYDTEVQKLGPLTTFDPALFVGDDKCPQEVCNFVLALAVAYNDLRDLTLTRRLLIDMEPPQEDTPTYGNWSGLGIAWLRVSWGQLNELLVLLEENKKAIEHTAFQALHKRIDKKARNAWESLLEVAHNRRAVGGIGKALLLARNKISFHYDAKKIGIGYKARFVEETTAGPPYESSASSMESTRFYFADAAAYQVLQTIADEHNEPGLLQGNLALLDEVNRPLYQLVTRFKAQRNTPYRKVRT